MLAAWCQAVGGMSLCSCRPPLLPSTPPTAPAMQIPWLIAIAFWLSGGFIRSGLGARIAYSIVALFGKTTLASLF